MINKDNKAFNSFACLDDEKQRTGFIFFDCIQILLILLLLRLVVVVGPYDFQTIQIA